MLTYLNIRFTNLLNVSLSSIIPFRLVLFFFETSKMLFDRRSIARSEKSFFLVSIDVWRKAKYFLEGKLEMVGYLTS